MTGIWRTALTAGLFGALLAAPRAASAQPQIVGYLSNFDVPNNVKDANGNSRETEGFEIQIEGVQINDVQYAFGEAGALNGPPAPCYIRYCRPQIIQYVTGVYVRWTVAGWDSVAQQFTTNFNIPGMALSSAGTPPVSATTFFAGHQCWSMGLGAKYPQGGCEHFGVTLAKNAGAVTYRWIVGDATTGTLTYADGTALPTAGSLPPSVAVPQVPVLNPGAVVANNGQVQAVIQAPPPAALLRRYGDAMWVKVYKKELGRQADLDELVGGHPNNNVPGVVGDHRDGAAVAETEWKLLQLDTCTNSNRNNLSGGGSGSSSHGVVRRYEFYKYDGPVAPSGATGCGKGVSRDEIGHATCAIDPLTNECFPPADADQLEFIGAHNVAQDLDQADGKTHQSIAFAGLLDVKYPHAAIALNGSATSGLGVTFAAVGNELSPGVTACSVSGNILTINGAGGCVVTASQGGDATWAPASDVLRGFIINKASQTITFAAPAGPFRFGDAPFDLSATSSSGLAVEFTANGACSVAGSTVTVTAPGQCDLTASQPGDGNVNAADPITIHISIAKGAATVTFDAASLRQTYSGSAKSVSASTTPANLAVVFAFTGTPQNAGGYPVTATIDDVNYDGSASATLTIDKAAATISVTGFSGAYDGAAHGATGTANGVLGESLNVLLALGATFTNAPGGTANWSFAGDDNYNTASGSVAVTIGKADVTVSTTGGSVTFDGLAHGSVGTASVPGSFAYAFTPGGAAAPVDAGTYQVTATFTPSDATNFNGASALNTIVIGQASSSVSISCPASVVATGSALTPCTASATGVGMSAINVTASIVYTNNVNGPTATATATWAGDANHTGSSSSAGFSITAPPPPPPTTGLAIVPPGDQHNAEGDKVELQLQVTGVSGRKSSDDDEEGNAWHGKFSATALPPGLEIEKGQGIIRGKLKKGSAGLYHVTVSFTQGGVTATQVFSWVVAR